MEFKLIEVMEIQSNTTYEKQAQFSRLGMAIIRQRMDNPVNRKLRYGYSTAPQHIEIPIEEDTKPGIVQWLMARVDRLLEEEVR